MIKILVSEDIIDSEDAQRVLLKEQLQSGPAPHPLVLIAKQQIRDKRITVNYSLWKCSPSGWRTRLG